MKTMKVLDTQSRTCPEDVEKEIEDIWRYLEYGNDYYYWSTCISDLREMEEGEFEVERWYWGVEEGEKKGWFTERGSVQALIKYLQEEGLGDEETILIHYWW